MKKVSNTHEKHIQISKKSLLKKLQNEKRKSIEHIETKSKEEKVSKCENGNRKTQGIRK
ncbi:hypothetical protein HMPREF1508_1592 [Shuttleworthella sp. MSX8B]|nr:hypothetical protein HMPREF1508_1592 [Shuttleworthia sp. MSX8B]